MKKFFTYIKESVGEVRHIKWPTKQETIIYTVAVVIISVAVAYYLGLWDMIFTSLLEQVI